MIRVFSQPPLGAARRGLFGFIRINFSVRLNRDEPLEIVVEHSLSANRALSVMLAIGLTHYRHHGMRAATFLRLAVLAFPFIGESLDRNPLPELRQVGQDDLKRRPLIMIMAQSYVVDQPSGLSGASSFVAAIALAAHRAPVLVLDQENRFAFFRYLASATRSRAGRRHMAPPGIMVTRATTPN